jgi:signal transduction histidine kinase
MLLNNIETFDTENIRRILNYINLSAKPTLDVLTNLLDWVNAQTGQLGFQPEWCNVKELMQDVIEILTPTVNIKNIDLIHNISEDIELHADVNMLKSVLQNLITNAIKFSHPGGRVDVIARKKGDYVEFEIADQGVGMDDKQIEMLFRHKSHISTKGTSGEKGSGLGLILCKEFIERHNGEIRVESRPENGSRFMFTIPLGKKENH